MRALFMTVMLIIVAVAIYNHTIGGNDGMRQQIIDSGGKINVTIGSINP